MEKLNGLQGSLDSAMKRQAEAETRAAEMETLANSLRQQLHDANVAAQTAKEEHEEELNALHRETAEAKEAAELARTSIGSSTTRAERAESARKDLANELLEAR